MFLLQSLSATATPPGSSDGVIVRKIGPTYLFVFPSVKGVKDPAGKISIGNTITILYALEIIRGRARFVGVDASKLAPEVFAKIKLAIKSAKGDPGKRFGFMVRDINQPKLDIFIDPSFMRNVKSKARDVQQKMAREGNLNLTIGTEDGSVRILSVVCD